MPAPFLSSSEAVTRQDVAALGAHLEPNADWETLPTSTSSLQTPHSPQCSILKDSESGCNKGPSHSAKEK